MKNNSFKQVKRLTDEQINEILERAKGTATNEELEKLKAKLQKCTIEYRDTYIKSEDITLIICEGYIQHKKKHDREYIFTKVSGFYYGEPDILSTHYFCENPIAVFLMGI